MICIKKGWEKWKSDEFPPDKEQVSPSFLQIKSVDNLPVDQKRAIPWSCSHITAMYWQAGGFEQTKAWDFILSSSLERPVCVVQTGHSGLTASAKKKKNTSRQNVRTEQEKSWPGINGGLCGRQQPPRPHSLPHTMLSPPPTPPTSIGWGRWLQWVILGPRSKANYSRRLCKM